MTDGTIDIRDAVRAVLPVLREHAAQVDADAVFPVTPVQALRDSGLLGLLVPVRYGGLGGGLGDLVEVAQDLAGACLSTAMIWAMHCQQSDALVRHAAPELAERLLPRVARGEVYLASVTTEPGKGGHLLRAQAPLTHSGLEVSFARTAPVVTGGRHADGFLITMRESADAPESRVSLVYADRQQLDIVPGAPWDTLGMRGTDSAGLRLHGKVPAWQLVGEPGGFRRIAIESTAPVGHLAWAACWLGSARSALRQLVALCRSPDRPRGLDISSDLVAERLARARMDLEVVAAYLSRVRDEVTAARARGESLDRPDVQIHLNTLKVTAAESTFRAVDRMVQLAGLGTGYSRRSALPLERHFRDLRSASLNYSDDRLLTVTGALTLMDRSVRLA
ncbi:acyl-CoA dehydrogenase family protein [Streptomyces sp. NPDC048514]|uniref:acyl-CoA dehydrogenase family protein n=1 Tax=Streptomyces sp. NPDC048514 TaxID=3365564 RepID=UPI00371F88B0